MNEILIIDNFLSSNECDELVALYDATPFRTNDLPGFWSQRIKWPKYSEHLEIKLTKDRKEIAENHFQKKFRIDNLNMTLWNVGHRMSAHNDYGAVNEFPWRDYASLIYLNDDFEGGELFIPSLHFINRPKKGQMITFEGSKLLHGVNEITKGRRLTSACWFKVL